MRFGQKILFPVPPCSGEDMGDGHSAIRKQWAVILLLASSSQQSSRSLQTQVEETSR
jgi:hypothetical protein